MLGNFTFYNPTKLYFGENSLDNLSKELGKYGEKVMLVYGSGSIRKNGIYDAVLAELRKAGKQTVELSGVMPNPTIEKVMEGVALARKEAVDFILAVGGGSVCDYCKAAPICRTVNVICLTEELFYRIGFLFGHGGQFPYFIDPCTLDQLRGFFSFK